MDVLASVFFVVAAGWLLVALLYALLALTFLRIRARGNLDRIYDEDFGRVYIYGTWYLPLGCILRRYIQHMLRSDQPSSSSGRGSISRFMTRDERRAAMEVLLRIPHTDRTSSPSKRKERAESLEKDVDCEAPTSPHNHNASFDERPVCSICLGSYEEDDTAASVLQSVTCPHRFHNECILDWLQRQANLECPCCRLPMVSEVDVWTTVKRNRKERRKQLRRERQKNKQVNSCHQQPETESTDSGDGAVVSVHSSSMSSSSAVSSSSTSASVPDLEDGRGGSTSSDRENDRAS